MKLHFLDVYKNQIDRMLWCKYIKINIIQKSKLPVLYKIKNKK